MNTEHAVPVQSDDVTSEVDAFILNYEPKLLSPGQREAMLTDIKAAVMATTQPSKISAGQSLAALCRFVADTAPRSGCALTDVQLARWAADRKGEWGEGRTLSTLVGRVRQVLRRQSGLPARINPERRRRVGAPPLSGEQYAALRELCVHGPLPVARAFAAAFGAGRPACYGAGCRFADHGGSTMLVSPDGTRRRVLDEAATARLIGQEVDPADWDALVDLAALRLRLRVDPPVVFQTFRKRPFSDDIPAVTAIKVFQLTTAAVDQVIDFLTPVDIALDVEAQAVLRGWRRHHTGRHETSRGRLRAALRRVWASGWRGVRRLRRSGRSAPWRGARRRAGPHKEPSQWQNDGIQRRR